MLSNTEPKLHKRARYLPIGFLIVILVVAAFTVGFWTGSRSPSKPESVLVLRSQSLQNGTTILPKFSGYQLQSLYRDVPSEDFSGLDASFIYAYFPQNRSSRSVYVLFAVAESLEKFPNVTVSGVTVVDTREIQILQDPLIIGRYLVLTYPSNDGALSNYAQVNLYWYKKALFDNGTTIQQKWARTTLVILTQHQEDYKQLEQTLLTFGRSIAKHWESLVPPSPRWFIFWFQAIKRPRVPFIR